MSVREKPDEQRSFEGHGGDPQAVMRRELGEGVQGFDVPVEHLDRSARTWDVGDAQGVLVGALDDVLQMVPNPGWCV